MRTSGARPASPAFDPIAAAGTGDTTRPMEHRASAVVAVAVVVPAATGITHKVSTDGLFGRLMAGGGVDGNGVARPPVLSTAIGSRYTGARPGPG